MEWQPIEAAPKDGADMWLYQQGQEPEQFVGYFCNDGGGTSLSRCSKVPG